jgi:hypothetical protein
VGTEAVPCASAAAIGSIAATPIASASDEVRAIMMRSFPTAMKNRCV